MLNSFHYFIQVKSAYKAALRAHALGLTTIHGISFDMTFYSEMTCQQMIDRYVPHDVRIFDASAPSNLSPIDAGAATLWVKPNR